MLRVQKLQMKFDLASTLVFGISSALTFSIGILHVRNGSLSLGSLLLVISYLGQLYGPLRSVTKKISDVQSWLRGPSGPSPYSTRCPTSTTDPARGRWTAPPVPSSSVHVIFGYSAEHPVLRDVSFRAPAGARVGIAGPTGAGKTTLLTLMTRFYDPSSGEILIDGTDLRELKLTDLRNQFAIVHQDPVLFSASLAENILYGRSGASQADVEAAARAANAHDFIVQLPDGYDTLVGERGMRLSGGERQRVALARAFLKDAPVLLLDEPTSSVDVKTESMIIEALDRLMVGRTTFMIAHRLSTLEGCDILLEVADGRVTTRAGAVEQPVGTS